MYLKFDFNSSMPKEFGENVNKCVYYIDDKKISSVDPDEPFECIKNISKINFFVGANNSGKSRFLRGLMKLNHVSYKVSTSEKNIEFWIREINKWYEENHIKVYNMDNNIGNKINDIYVKLNITNTTYQNLVYNFSSNINIYNEVNSLKQEDRNRIRNISRYYDAISLRLNFLDMISNLGEEARFAINRNGRYKIYLPILRSIKKSNSIPSSTFEDTIKHLYNFNEQDVFTGLKLYDKVLRIRNNVKEERKSFEKFEKFLSKYFFNNESVEIISSLDEDKHLILYVGGEENKIHDIGDGIQAIILLMFPIFTSKDNSWVFIEEPETYLHPGLQRVFIETLINDEFLKTKNLTYFFTTHSNHFLDLTLISNEITIFQFEKENFEKFNIKVDVKPKKEVLDILGVNTSSVFLANTSIWIEGPTDRKYLSFFLKKYCEENNKQYLKEDIDFAFFEYGGNLIAHYLFEKENFEANDEEIRDKINSFASANKIYLLADEDEAKTNTKKGKRRIALQNLSNNSINFKYQNTELTEIENLLPKKVIIPFLKKLVKNEHEHKLDYIQFNKTEYDRIKLGEFYENFLKKQKIPLKSQKAYKADSGTLKNDYKIKLCNFTINSDLNYKDIIEDNPILHGIIEELYNFITDKPHQ